MCAQVCPIGPAVEQPSNSKVSSCRASMMYDFHTREADWSLREIETFHWHDEDGAPCEGAGCKEWGGRGGGGRVRGLYIVYYI